MNKISYFFFKLRWKIYDFLHTTKEEKERDRKFHERINEEIDRRLNLKEGERATDEQVCDALTHVTEMIRNKEIEY